MNKEWSDFSEEEKQAFIQDLIETEWQEEMDERIAKDIAGTEQCEACYKTNCEWYTQNDGTCEDFIHFESRGR